MKVNFAKLARTMNWFSLLNLSLKFGKLVEVSYFNGNQFQYFWSQENK